MEWNQLFRRQSFLNLIITYLSSYFQFLKYKFVYFSHKYLEPLCIVTEYTKIPRS